MSLLSQRAQCMQPSATLSIAALARALQAQGIHVLDLSGGEPDFATPAVARAAAVDAMERGQTKYTAVGGTAELKAAIITKLARDNDLTYQSDEIVAGTGAKQILFNAFLATLDPEDEVIIPAPYWVSYPDMVTFAQGTPVIVTTDAAQGFKLTSQQLESAITPRTKWVILNAPSNPTGAVYTRGDLEALADVLRAHPQVWILSDDIYEHIIFDDQLFHTLAAVAPDLKNRTLIVNGVSKGYAMTGWRLGYGAGDQTLIKAMTDIQSQSTSNPCTITQAAATAILRADQSFLQDNLRIYQARRDSFIKGLHAIPGLQPHIPQGAFYAFAHVENLMGRRTPAGMRLETDTDVADFFLREAGVAGVPGTAFGMSPYFRMSFATSDTILDQAVLQIAQAVNTLSA